MPTRKANQVPVAELVLDFAVYPRGSTIDETHASRLAEALRAGETFPAIVADRKSRRVVDGFHRCRAYQRVFGDNAISEVEWRDYPDDGALFKDAGRLNVRHGLRLSRLDEAHCMAVAARLGIPDSEMSEILALTQKKYDELRAARFGTDANGEPVLLKRSNRHLAGSKVTKRQAAGNARSSGWRLDFHIDQLVNALEHDLVNYQDPAIVPKLRRLTELLDRVLVLH
jgi:hypothetical protein